MSHIAEALRFPLRYPFSNEGHVSKVPKVDGKDKGPGNAWLNGNVPEVGRASAYIFSG